jgi:hypothetical protein
MSLSDNLPIFLPLTPRPPTEEVEKISAALEVAITVCIRTSFVPSIGTIFLSNLTLTQNTFLSALAVYLDLTVSPIISAALAAQASVGGPIPAWLSIQPSFDAISLAAPPFMAGVFGNLFWLAIIYTIRTAILPPTGESSESSDSTTDLTDREEVLRVET